MIVGRAEVYFPFKLNSNLLVNLESIPVLCKCWQLAQIGPQPLCISKHAGKLIVDICFTTVAERSMLGVFPMS